MIKEELYISYISKQIYITGTTTSDTTDKLIDSGALFITGTTPISQNDLVFNTNTNLSAKVVSVDSDTQLTLSVDIFPTGSSPIGYKIYKKITERVELLESLNPNITFNIADIAKPDQRKSDYSKTIKLPGSKKLNQVFENIFEVNIDLNTFNPNLKTDVLYLVDGEINLDGYLQLKQVDILDNDDVVYQCTIVGRVGNFIKELGANELTDLDMSSLNHLYDKTRQVATWNYPLSTDYVYPMINYDINYAGQPFTEGWDVEDFYPAITVKKYIDEIFSAAGYEYTSAFFEDTYFENLIIPFSSKNFALTETAINARIFEANTPEVQATGLDYLYALEQNDWTSFDDDVINNTTEVYDVSNVHSIVTGVYTPNEDGYYNIEAMLQLQGVFTAPSAGVTNYELVSYIHGYIEINKYTSGGVFVNTLDQITFGVSDIGASVAPSGTATTAAAPTTPSTDYIYCNVAQGFTAVTYSGSNTNSICNKYFVNASNVFLSSNELIKLEIKYAVRKDSVYNALFGASGWRIGGTYYSGPVNGYKLNLLSGYFKNSVVNSGYVEGNTIDMNGVIPLKIKQKDFFMSIVKMFNLYVQSDTANEKNLFIEPRDDFYNSTVADWSQKLDVSKQLEFLPMGALDSKEYLFTYKQDKDYYNELYNDTWGEIYGQRKEEVVNDFINKTFKTEIIFSPTPSVGQEWYDRVIPTIIKFDDKNGVQRTESNIRILQWAGMKSTDFQWTYDDNSGSLDLRNEYPFAGMYNEPFQPTEDIGFGLTNEIYWAAVFNKTIIWSNSNLYNKFYKKFIEEITDINSKIVKGWFYLRPSDIRNLSFRNQYYFDGAYFRLNKIENYNPSNPITKCEFLKIKDADAFVTDTTTATGGIDVKLGTEDVPKFANGDAQLKNGNSLGNRSQNIQGNDNYISRSATNVDIKGNDNKVYSNAYNITIQGNDNIIRSGVENVTLINTNNTTVSSSDVTYINNEARGAGSIVIITSSTAADESVVTYEADTSGGSILVTLPSSPTIGKIWNFKKTVAANTLQLRTAGSETIDGGATLNITGLNHSYTVQYDGTNYIII